MLRSLIVLVTSFTAFAAFGDITPEGAEFFEKRIAPILKENCFKCHSHSADKIKGGLVLDSADGAFTGGDTGPAVVPGDLGKSLLITAISYKDDDLQMPPKGKKLADEQIAALTDWVKMGAPWPQSAKGQKMTVRAKGKITDEDRKWWAFQPMAKPEVPKVDDHGWCVNEIDRFIFKKLAENGMKPAPPAKPEQLARRLYFDVTGLPPTPEESAAFVSAHGKDQRSTLDAPPTLPPVMRGKKLTFTVPVKFTVVLSELVWLSVMAPLTAPRVDRSERADDPLESRPSRSAMRSSKRALLT